MTLRKYVSLAIAPVLLALVTFGTPTANAAVVDYVGFGWEDGGLETSVAGDQLTIATVVTQIDPLFDVNLGTDEATLFIDGLTSLGAIYNPATGATTITYSGGTLSLYADASNNSDWGTNPANATVPSTFVDGYLVFEGEFSGFSLTLLPSGNGIFEGFLNATGGVALVSPCSGCAYTFAGTFTAPSGAQIPTGYDLQVDGVLEVESAVATETMSWGSVKNLYRSGQ